MKNKLLFPHRFRVAGWFLLLAGILLFIAWTKYDFKFSFLDVGVVPEQGDLGAIFEDHNLTNELAGIGILAGLLLIAFSREKSEDERTTLLRLQSLQISHYLTYLTYAIALFTINGISFLLALLYLPYAFLIIFILVYYCRTHLLPKFATHEE